MIVQDSHNLVLDLLYLVLDGVAGDRGAVVAQGRLPLQLDGGVRPVRDLRQPGRARRVEGVLIERMGSSELCNGATTCIKNI